MEHLVVANHETIAHSAQSPSDRFLTKLRAAWDDLNKCAEGIPRDPTQIRSSSDSSSLKETRDWYGETTWVLLAEPVEKFLRLHPCRRMLEAIGTCDQENALDLTRSRKRIDARFVMLMIRTSLDLCEPWRIWRGGNRSEEWRGWEKRRASSIKDASELLDSYARWAKSIKPQNSHVNAGGNAVPAVDRSDVWWRQHSALIATLQDELALRNLTLAWFNAEQSFVNETQQEWLELQLHAKATLDWLEVGNQSGTNGQESFWLVTPDERLRAWGVPMEKEASQRLPERVEFLVDGRELRLHSVNAREVFLKALDRYARAPMRTIMDQSWHRSAACLRQVEQAKEMIDYWSEASSNHPTEAADLMEDARRNAIAGLAEQLQAPSQTTEMLEAAIVEAFRTWQERGMLAVEAEQYGWLPLLSRPRGRAFLGTLIESSRQRARSFVELGARWASGRFDQLMESFGGKVPSRPAFPAVIRRATLRDTFSLAASSSELPALYRSLFRLAPVEDRRFLVGRDQELAGLDQALTDWNTGRFAACLLIGARGSGKSSLLNCAVADTFAGQPCIRGKFHERITSPAALDSFLRNLLGLDQDADLEAAFQAERRILIIEEGERIYLRTVGGFAAAHHLTYLIHRTASTTFWVIVMNDRSFRVLDAGTQLHRLFSHRINAMNVSRADLESAILERHRLSGLRLEFAPPPLGDPRVNRIKRWIGLEESPQTLFFDSLLQQSEGIFRSAFQLWLSSIEGVEGGVLKIRQPLDPAFNQFRHELAQEDQFTLLMIQEHGSLTQHELAEVLCETHEQACGRLERLAALGLIEADREHPGIRVHPEAQRFVNDLLRRTNFT